MEEELQLEPLAERNPSDSDPLLENQANLSTGSSNEIKDEDLEAASAACCRICLEYDGEPGEELISPCMCKGTQQFVHRYCLEHWRSVKANILLWTSNDINRIAFSLSFLQEGFAFSHCKTCKAQFHLRVIAVMVGFAYFMDKNGEFRNLFSDDWDRILSKHPIPFYNCIVKPRAAVSFPII
ncbi:hypothetical protein HHK36_006103 [Tetracentron sinense]|uniref:RING-CH-type domain-containing protein n=1 Tax=Tetracentron sinense TaxID=13715 RepID=A0A835DNS6_TETSI|nr:hypothetical protein HHK36_006103 [Tetracentron sinense]